MNEENIDIPERSYWAFLSYRRADNLEQDRNWASWLHMQVEHYDVPSILIGKRNKYGAKIPEKIFPIFRDEKDLPADSSLRDSIHSALENSSTLIVLCSPRAVDSRYVADEISYFISLGKGKRIIPAILAGEPGDPLNECFPAQLRELTVGNNRNKIWTGDSQPLAADFRLDNGEEGFTSPETYRHKLEQESSLSRKQVERTADAYEQKCQSAKLKIIAGVLGVGLDDLQRRDKAYRLEREKQKTRILRRWLGVVIGLGLITVAAGFLANSMRIESERARSDAEDLIAFLQDDAKVTLSQVGRLDLMESLNKAVFGYLDKNYDSTSGLRHRVKAKAEYDKAVLFLELGRTSDAKKPLEQAVKNSKTAAKLQRRDNWLDVAAVASYKYGEILYNEGKLIEATEFLDEAGQLATRSLDLDPGNAYALTAQYGRNFILANIKAKQGLYDEALSDLFELNAWFENERAARFGKTEMDHVIIMTQISRIASDAGRHLKAIEVATQALQLSQDVTPGEQRDRAGVMARLQLATVLELSTNLKKAARILEQALVTSRQRLGIEPRSREWNGLTLRISRALADIYALDGENAKAYNRLEEVISCARLLHQMDSTSTEDIQMLVDSLLDQARFVMLKSYPDVSAAVVNASERGAQALGILRFAQKANIPPVFPNGWSEQFDELKIKIEAIQVDDN